METVFTETFSLVSILLQDFGKATTETPLCHRKKPAAIISIELRRGQNEISIEFESWWIKRNIGEMVSGGNQPDSVMWLKIDM